MSFQCKFDRNGAYFQHISINVNRESDTTSKWMINVKLSFKIIRLTFCDLTYARWRLKWLPDFYMF